MPLLTRLTMGWLAIAAFVWPSWAASGLPLIALLEPALNLGFIPIVLAEAWFLRRALPNVSKTRLLGASVAANGFSTLVGVPLTWAAWMVVNVGWKYVRDAAGVSPSGWFGKVLSALLGGAWVAGDKAMYWIVPVALLEILLVCFFVSYGSEAFIVRRFLPAADGPEVQRAVWRGNRATYGFLAVLTVGFLIFDVVRFGPGSADKEPEGGTMAPPRQVGALDLDDDVDSDGAGKHEITALSFAPNGEMLAIFDVRDRRAVPSKAELQVWDVRDNTRIVTVPGLHANPFLYKQQLFWGPNAAYVLVLDEHLTCVDPKGGKACPAVPNTPISAGAFNKDGTRFVAIDPNNNLVIYGTDAWSVQATLPVQGHAQDVRWTADDQLALLTMAPTEPKGNPMFLTVLDPSGAASPRTQRLSPGLHAPFPSFVSERPDGRGAVVASLEFLATLVDFEHLEAQQEVALRDRTVGVSGAAYCNERTLLLQYFPRIEHVRPERGHTLGVVASGVEKEIGWFPSSARQVAVNAATQRLATSKRNRVRLYDLATLPSCSAPAH